MVVNDLKGCKDYNASKVMNLGSTNLLIRYTCFKISTLYSTTHAEHARHAKHCRIISSICISLVLIAFLRYYLHQLITFILGFLTPKGILHIHSKALYYCYFTCFP
eukprot:c23875_g1_i3 orf=355-672(-)